MTAAPRTTAAFGARSRARGSSEPFGAEVYTTRGPAGHASLAGNRSAVKPPRRGDAAAARAITGSALAAVMGGAPTGRSHDPPWGTARSTFAVTSCRFPVGRACV